MADQQPGHQGARPLPRVRLAGPPGVGAASIAWFHEYCVSGYPAVRRRILDYNQDDTRATAVLLDALVQLPVGAPAWVSDPMSDGVGGRSP